MGGRGASSMSAMSAMMASASVELQSFSIAERVPDWYMDKKLMEMSQGERYAWSVGDGAYVKRETEKAYLLANNTDFGTVSMWVPKSIIPSNEQFAKDMVKREKSMKLGSDYRTYLINRAESAGVSTKKYHTTKDIQGLMDKAGASYVSKDSFAKNPVKVPTQKTTTTKKISNTQKTKNSNATLSKSQAVSTSFGKGKVVRVDGDVITVKLDSGQTKKLMKFGVSAL